MKKLWEAIKAAVKRVFRALGGGGPGEPPK
jgi:chromosome segregation ATPase